MSQYIQSNTGPSGSVPTGFHRLAPEKSIRGTFLTSLIIAVIWTLVTVGLLVSASSKDTEKAVSMWLVLIFGLADIFFIAWAAKSFLRWTMTGQTTVDVSSPTAIPGEPFEIIVSQPGQFQISKCLVDLICRERATYTAGTDTQTQTEVVRSIPLCDLSSVTARNGQMLTRQMVNIPEDAMLSFDAPNNKITWMVRVKMEIPRRPDTEQLFPVRILSRAVIEAEGVNHG